MKKLYFPAVSLVVLALTLVGFQDNLFTDVGQPSNSDPKFIIHGLFCLAWPMVFAVQANFVRTGNLRLHRQLGATGLVVAAGVVLSTLYVFVAIWNGWGAMAADAKANRLLLPAFLACVWLAWSMRTRPDWHRRLLLVGTLYMLGPVLMRASILTDPFVPHETEEELLRATFGFTAVVWNALFLSLFAYDLATLRRVHRVTVAGYGLFWAIWVVALLA